MREDRHMEIQALLADDEFVLRVAHAVGYVTFASVREYPNPDDLHAADAAAEADAIASLRVELTEAFKGYAGPVSPA